MEYYSATKRSEALTLATTWLKLESVMQSEISQTIEGQILYDSKDTRYLK